MEFENSEFENLEFENSEFEDSEFENSEFENWEFEKPSRQLLTLTLTDDFGFVNYVGYIFFFTDPASQEPIERTSSSNLICNLYISISIYKKMSNQRELEHKLYL